MFKQNAKRQMHKFTVLSKNENLLSFNHACFDGLLLLEVILFPVIVFRTGAGRIILPGSSNMGGGRRPLAVAMLSEKLLVDNYKGGGGGRRGRHFFRNEIIYEAQAGAVNKLLPEKIFFGNIK